MTGLPLEAFPEPLHGALQELSKVNDITSFGTKGANGYIVFGTNKVLNRPIVTKFYYWENGDHAEPELLAKLEHPNILKVYHAASIDEDYAFFTTKHCSGGDLDSVIHLRRVKLLDTTDIAMQVSSGVAFLHGHSYVHRDLKAENVFCDEGNYVIGDFGSVARCDATGYTQTLTKHSLIYRPPESVGTNDYLKAGDIYQLGILLYQLLGGHFPYDERDWLNTKQQKIYESKAPGWDRQSFATSVIEGRITKGSLLDLSSLPSFVPTSLKTIIRRATRVKAGDRYKSVSDFIAALNNVKGKLPDWRIDDVPTLYRRKKSVRYLFEGKKLVIEKDVGNGWKRHHGHSATTEDEAVIIAEGL